MPQTDFETDLYALETGFLSWPLVCAILVTGMVLLWILVQLREHRRLLRTKRIAHAIRHRELGELEGLRKRMLEDPLHDILLELSEMLRLEAHRREARRREARSRQEEFDRLPLACIVLDDQARITGANREAGRILGRDEQDLIGRDFAAFSGDHAPGQWILSEGTDAPQLAVLVGGTRAEAALPENMAHSARSLEATARFAGCVAHDFNDALTTILGHSSLLLGRLAEDDPARESVDEIARSAEGARRVTNQLLAFARPRVTSKEPLRPKREGGSKDRDRVASETPLVLLVEDNTSVRSMVSGVLERHGYRVRQAGDGDEAIEVYRASEEPVDLLLTDVRLPRMNGISLYAALQGLNPDLDVVFMSGFVESEVFQADYPQREFLQKPFTPRELLEKLEGARTGRFARPGGKKRVLVVDDEEATRRLVRELVEGLDCECITAESGREALEVLAATRIDVVVSDMVMPGLDGLETCAAIKERHPEVRFIVVSGRMARASNQAAARKLGAVSTLSRPFSKDELRLALQSAFRGDEGDRSRAA